MIANPQQTSFFKEVGVGLLLSVLAAAAATAALMFFPSGTVIRAVIAGVAFAYLCVSLGHASEKTGRFVVLIVWLVAAGAAWLSGIGIAGYVAVHVTLLWLVRSLYFYSTVIEAALDLGLMLTAIGFATWAAFRTDSLLLACWSFFLLQALHVCIPYLAARLMKPETRDHGDNDPNRRFADASKAADEALRRIAAIR